MTGSVNPAGEVAIEPSRSGQDGLVSRPINVHRRYLSSLKPVNKTEQSVAQCDPFSADFGLSCTHNVKPVKIEEVWHAFAQVNDWIRFADAKAAALLATGGVLGGLLVNATPSSLPASRLGVATIVLFVLAATADAFSVLMSLLALQPRLGARTAATSLIYFDHIARRFGDDRDGFVEAFADISTGAATDALSRDISRQIWANSLVARRKFRHVTSATWLLGAAMLVSGVAALLQRI